MSRWQMLPALLWMQLACSSPPSSDVKAAMEKLDSSDPEQVSDAFPVAAGRLSERISDEERAAIVAALEKGMSVAPAPVVAALERDRSRLATRRYARAMLESGRGQALGGQLALVLRAGDESASAVEVLSRPERRDLVPDRGGRRLLRRRDRVGAGGAVGSGAAGGGPRRWHEGAAAHGDRELERVVEEGLAR